MSYDECFMCGKTNRNILEDREFFNLETKMPKSNKNLQVVLEHLASCCRTKLIFSTDTSLCNICFEELAEYDGLMVQLMENQKVLTNKLKGVLSSHLNSIEANDESIVPYDTNLPTNDTQLEDALNPELDTKEEFVEEMGEEIAQSGEYILADDIVLDSKEELIEGDEIIIAEFIDENSEIIVETNEGSIIEEDDIDISEQPNFEYLQEDWTSDQKIDNMIIAKTRETRKCQHCGETFKSKILLKNHVLKRHKVQVFACKICGVQRKDEEYLELHMNIHHGKTEFECRYCDKKFSRPVNTLRHMRKHWDKKGYQCEKCGERFSLDNMLYNHKKRHEAEENPLICSICNQSFKSMKTYNHHQLIHQENRPRHQCPICPKSFTERYTLKMHMNVHPPVQEVEVSKQYDEDTCVICEANFESKDLLISHLKNNHDVILK